VEFSQDEILKIIFIYIIEPHICVQLIIIVKQLDILKFRSTELLLKRNVSRRIQKQYIFAVK